jgi:hypothetical protein
VDELYQYHPRVQKLPDKLIDLYYFTLSEEKRIVAIREVFQIYEENPAMQKCVDNLLDYFQWARNTRNQLLHAENYPASFGGKPDTLYLTKRIAKQSPKSGHMKFGLQQLRTIADQVRAGIVQSAEINIHLRFRNAPADRVPKAALEVLEALPSELFVPATLELTPRP